MRIEQTSRGCEGSGKRWLGRGLLLALAAALGCKRAPPPEVQETPGITLADTGFRPAQHGYKFENTGGQYPKTPPVLTAGGVVKLFGKEACAGGDDRSCKLTPAAVEWMAMVNKKMNMGQCEGMAVSSLAFFKKIIDPAVVAPGAASAHDLTHAAVSPLIGYYWAFQTVNPVLGTKVKSLLTQTPNAVEDTLVEMMKRGDLATVAIRSDHGGHAVSPYAVEDRGNGVHWIRIYDNNWPDTDRHIVIDRNANTWKYELASLNPDVPKEPWAGSAESHTIAVVSLSARLGRAECPFCTGGGQKLVVPSGTNAISLSDHEGRKIGVEGGKVVNEIPGASVVSMDSFMPGQSGDLMYSVPADADYDVHLHGTDQKATDAHADGDHGVAIIGNGQAVAVETSRLKPGETDTLSVHREGAVKYRSSTGGVIPPIRLAHDGDGTHGMSARISNMKADAHEPLELRMDHRAGEVHVAGGGKKSESFDLKVKHVHAGAEDHEVEHKGIKYKAGETHTLHVDPKPGAKPGPIKITKAPTPRSAAPAKEAPRPGPKPAPGKPRR